MGHAVGAYGLIPNFSFDSPAWNRNGKVARLALTKTTALWIWAFLIERSVHPETTQTRENRLEALELFTFRRISGRSVDIPRTLLLLLLGFRG